MKKTTKKIIASALAAAMVMASSVMTFADEATGYEELTKCTFDSEMTVEEGVATVTISLSGDCSAFDFGLMYDADTMEYTDWDMTADFSNAFTKKAQGISTVNDQTAQSYVVFAGAGDECQFNGEALIVKFNIKGDEATPINVVKDSKYVLDAYNAAGSTGTLQAFLASDAAPSDAPTAVVVPVPEPTVDDTTTPPSDDDNNNDNNNNNNNNDNNNNNNDTNSNNDNTTNNNATNNNNTQGTATTTAPATTTSAAANKTKSPKTGDAGVVLPIVAICGAAAAVVVASKKKVED